MRSKPIGETCPIGQRPTPIGVTIARVKGNAKSQPLFAAKH